MDKSVELTKLLTLEPVSTLTSTEIAADHTMLRTKTRDYGSQYLISHGSLSNQDQWKVH